MSTLTGERDDIAGALALASRFVAAHTSNPQLNHLHVRVLETGEAEVQASDQRSSIRATLWATASEKPIDALLHPDVASAVKAMPQGPVTLTLDGTTLSVSGKGKGKYSVSTLDAQPGDPFPGESEVKWEDVQAIDASEALAAMEVATRFAAKKEDNPSIVGVNLRVADGELAVEATDGARLFHDRVPLPAAGFPFDEDEVLVPTRMVAELNRVFPSGEVMFAATPNLFFARDPNGEVLFASRRIGGKFPDLTKIIPKYEGHTRVPRQDLADALNRMRSVVRGKPVQLSFDGSDLKLSSKTSTGSGEEWVALPEEAKRMDIAFNLDYLAEAVSLFDGAELRVHVDTPLRPAKFDDGGVRLALLAPVKF